MNEREIFVAAFERADMAERRAFLESACGDDRALRQRVEALLSLAENAGGFLEPSATVGPTMDQTSDAERPGGQIGPYKLLETIGEGGFGIVFMAEQQQPLRRKVAVKVLKPGMDTRQVVARFEAERQALAIMDHPNIAKVLDGGATPAGRPFFVMELVKGVPISDFCDQNRLSTKQRLELFVPVCQAVQHAHQKGIIHRDLKPSNVLVSMHDSTPVVKVIDFGVAKALGQSLTDKTLFTGFAQMLGTPLYMSPEQAGQSGLDVDTRSDIYSLGVLLYELLTGSTPFDKQRFHRAAWDEMLRIIREEEPPKPSARLSTAEQLPSIAASRASEPRKLNRLLRGELDWIVMKCLEKDRNRRYESASLLAMDVEHYLTDEPVLARRPSAGYRLRKFLRRNKGPVLAVLLLLVVLLAGAVVSTWEAMWALAAEQLAKDEALRARQAETAAHEQRRVTDAVNEFLHHDLLAQASPEAEGRLEQPPDKDITLRTVLDRAAGRIAGRFPDQPLIEAAIRLDIGDAYFGLGEYDLALVHLQAAYELRRGKLGNDHSDTLAALEHVMRPYVAKGQFAQLETLVLTALDIRRRSLGRNHPETLKSETDLADLYGLIAQGDPVIAAKAEPLYRRVVEVRLQELGPNHPDTLMAQVKLAAYDAMRGRRVDAESLLTTTLDSARKHLDQDHPCVWEATYHLANLYEFQGQIAKAEPLRRSLLEGRRRKWGENHLTTLQYQASLAQFHTHEREYDKAEPLLRQVLDEYRERYGDDHPDTIDVQSRLAGLYVVQGEYA
ncbi:MAG TPA: serine/threonine-protein kinase, partial [Pirellulales bacterium]|nr:serine/threonine-protein kinase [Pirellulales bacterium]